MIRITPQEKKEISQGNLLVLKEVLRKTEESLTKKLKKANEMKTIRHIQGSLEVVDTLTSAIG